MFDDFLDVLEDDEFEEMPVDLTTFITSPDYMNQPRLSDKQFEYVELATNIYLPETNYKVYDKETADRLSRGMVNELCLLWGKGSGKNHSTTLAFARIAYLLLCLREPASYYGKPPGNSIDMLNVAVNAQQAKNTFFKEFKNVIEGAPWFRGRYTATRSGEINFDKNITLYSGHSEREAWEGYNFIAVVLDEIAAFATDSELSNSSNADRANTAGALYDMYSASVASRFSKVGKLVMISFSRFKGDFISQRYDKIVADKVTSKHSHVFKINEDGADDNPSNFHQIDWTEDKVVAYSMDGVYADKAPSWRINPTVKLEDLKRQALNDPIDFLTRFAGNPPDSIDAFFRDKEKVARAFSAVRVPLDDDGSFNKDFEPEPDTRYYVHVDLAERSDRAAVAMSHVSNWAYMYKGTPTETLAPVVTLDLVKWWSPSAERNIDFSEIREFILALRGRGFDIQVVSFDRWAGSISLQQELARAGVDVETQSVQRNEYNNLSLLIAESRMDGYNVPLLIDELYGLRVMPNGKVDHTRSGTNDLADAVCGSVFNASKYEEYHGSDIIEISNLEDVARPKARPKEPGGRIVVPPREPPQEVADFLSRLKTI